MSVPKRMKFGVFMAPFHRVGENPTLALERDLELLQWLDTLGFDEAYIGEHHSAGWETIASPEMFIATAAERTRHIRLGTGVTSLPYHHPFMVANRMVLLDHLTRGRVILGCGPGALASDALMLGIKPERQRAMMEESLDAIMRLMSSPEPYTVKTDWFEMNDAVLQLRPYQDPIVPVAVASVESPAGVTLAGKHGASVLTITVPRDPSAGPADLKGLWAIAEESAKEHHQTMNRHDWRLVLPVHLAETRKEALDDIRVGSAQYLREYSEGTNGRKPVFDGPMDKVVDNMAESGSWIVGTPDDCIQAINRLQEQSGGFGGFLVQTVDWTSREKMMRSYELLARYVMPQFQGTVASTIASNKWAAERQEILVAGRVRAIDRAKQVYADRQN